jgi:hypothetical protein
MSTAAEMVCREVYVRHTSTDGKSHVVEHRVWDAKLFIASQVAIADKLNAGVEGDGKRLAKAEQITRDQYMSEREPRR